VRLKYIEETFGTYFVFGEHPDGRVDLASQDEDAVATVSRESAKKIIADRNTILTSYYRLLDAFSHSDPGGCRKFWREEQGRVFNANP